MYASLDVNSYKNHNETIPMLIKSVRVVNFRIIKDETLDCEKITALIGANNTGKSTFLAAIKKFFEKNSKLDAEDINDKSKPTEIILTFDDTLDGLKEYGSNNSQEIKCIQEPNENKKHYVVVGFEDHGKLSETQITNSISNQFEFIFIPAVRDAAEDVVEKRESILGDLLKKIGDLNKIFESARADYGENLKKISTDSLDDISKKISNNIKEINPEISVKISKSKPEIPKFEFSIFERGEERALNKMGHGTQRNFIWSCLRAIVDAGLKKNVKTAVMLIEEPELYQHPPKLRQLRELLYKLVSDEPATQIIYATHSPNLVDFSKPENINLFKRTQDGKTVEIKKIDRENIPEDLGKTMMRNISDGFFCSKVILVEGFRDYSILNDEITKKIQQIDPKPNISEMMIIPVHSKDNLVEPATVFESFGINVYLMWDCDKDKYKECQKDPNDTRKRANMGKIERSNKKLAEFVKTKYPDSEFDETELFQSFSSDNFACFEEKFEEDGELNKNIMIDELVCKILKFIEN